MRLQRRDGELAIDVIDDGVGLPPNFSLDSSRGLGLQIVQGLVTSELGGSLEVRDDHGTRVSLRVPMKPAERVELQTF